MGMLMGALAGAAGAVEKTTEYALRAMMDEEKKKRIDEYASELDSSKDLTKRARDKAGAEEERARVAGIINEPVKVSQGDGMLGPATDDPAELAQTTRKPTNDEMINRLLTSGEVSTAAAVDKLDHSREIARDTRQLDRDKVADANSDRDFKLRQAESNIRASAEGRLVKGANLDNDIKLISLNNAKEVEKLRKEFPTATKERQAVISESIQILTGKDNDSYLPVQIKDEFGAVQGYKIFDKKRGAWVEGTGTAKAPYPDGQKLKKGNDTYTVKNGIPVKD